MLAGVLATGCARPPRTLSAAFAGAFLVGAALNAEQFSGRDTLGAALVTAQFNAITPENALKWESLHPRPGPYDFAAADQYVAFGERGRIRGWDVVNEALNEDGTLRPTPWLTIIGADYLAQAFRFAHQADPDAELYYNDYALENAPKRRGALDLVRRLRAEGVPVTGVGLQGHNRMDWPTPAQQDTTIAAFAALGVRVMITELDIDVLPRRDRPAADSGLPAVAPSDLNPYRDALPDSVQRALARRYAELFAVYLRHAHDISRVTFWGVADGDSWLNNWPVRGRTSYPLLFDRQRRPKPAFDAVLGVARR